MAQLDLKGRTELFTSEDCISGSNLHHYDGEIVVISSGHVMENWKEPFQKPEFQLFLARGGFGCDPNKMGNAVFGTFLEDGEECRMERYQIVGILKPELEKEFNLEWRKLD
jgi:hypothetical protein